MRFFPRSPSSLLSGVRLLLVGAAVSVFANGGRAADDSLVLRVEKSESVTGPWTLVQDLVLPAEAGSGVVRLRIDGGKPFRPPQGFVWVSPGTFLMGTPAEEPSRRTTEGPQTQVRISRGFWISKFETTQAEFEGVTGLNTSLFTAPDLPAHQVSWEEANEYCEKLTARERAAGRIPEGYVFRLPTEAEWEYVCRAGTTTSTAFGDPLSSTQANFDGSKPYRGAPAGPNLGAPTKGGTYPPNAWGVYDMHGNVTEWVMDWSTTGLPGGRVTDLVTPSTTGATPLRLHRGGAWHSEGLQCRSGSRTTLTRIFRSVSTGFRPILTTLVP